ncbi:hypothetical protein AAFC00_006059 [Neodothiora populina]|uniref:Uncharacterized protein n=1 Tax=Neodothiora populina TaxID=2781224 RepID=A0ABR3P6S9_9PEZI
MSSYISYFTPASWKQAQKNKSDLEATNPTDPVLNDEDERFLERITSAEGPAPPLPERPRPIAIADNGEEKVADSEETKEVEDSAGQLIVPTEDETVATSEASQVPSEEGAKAPGGNEHTLKEESASADTEKTTDESGIGKSNEADSEATSDGKEDKMTKSWASYLPSMPALTKKKSNEQTPIDDKKDETDAPDPPIEAPVCASPPKAKKVKKDVFPTQEEAEAATEALISQPIERQADSGRQTEDVSTTRKWSSYIPNISSTLSRSTPQEQASASLASVASAVKKGKEAEAKENSQTDDEKEVSVLLDRLNLSAINNRVFSFSGESQKVYQSFTVVLKDIIAGGPTAYEDLEKLIEENKEQLEKMFGNMPPFVQTLVKSLPAKMTSTLGPEVLAAMSEKPGNDMQAKMAAASSSSDAAASLNVPSSSGNKKQKRKISSARSLVSEKGAVATMLRNILNFLKLRFPAFVTGTNVLMSLAVFILLFVFWYCHKRGKEVRLLKEKEASSASADISEVDEESDLDASTILNEKDAASDSSSEKEPLVEEEKGVDKEDEAHLHGTDKTAAADDAKESVVPGSEESKRPVNQPEAAPIKAEEKE